MLRNLSAWHVLIVLLVVVLLFGAKRLPDVAKSVGQSMKIFKNEVKDLNDDDAAGHDARPPRTGRRRAGVTPSVHRPSCRPVQTPSRAPRSGPRGPTEGTAPPKV